MTNNISNDSRLYTIYVKPKKTQISTGNSKQDVKIKSHMNGKKITNMKILEMKNQRKTKSEIIVPTKQNGVTLKKIAGKPIGNPKGTIKLLQNLNKSKTIRNSISLKIETTKSEKSLLNSENNQKSKLTVTSNGPHKQSLTDNQMKFQLHSKPNFQYNKGKIEKVQLVSQEEQMCDIFRLAVAESGSSNFGENSRLPKLVFQALQQNISWPVIEQTLQECGAEPIITGSCFLIQLKFHRKIHLICSIRTTNVMSFKKSLMSLLKRYKTSYEPVLKYFHSSPMIEALASYCTVIEYSKFERNLAKDAVECGAKAIKIIDYETGAVNFQCQPLELPAMVDDLIRKHYRVLYTDYGFRPMDCVVLETQERKEYTRFLCDLRKFKEIENCYDNLSPLVGENGKGNAEN